MSSHSPQRALSLRGTQAHQLNQGLAQNLRESSRSPSLRERSRAMTAAPAAQSYASSPTTQQLNQAPAQASPTGSNNSRPSPPTAPIARHHATPPQASSSPGELGVPPSISQFSQNINGYNHNAHYSHTIGRSQAAALTRYQHFDESYQMTPELLEEIERADLEQSQTHSNSPAFTSYPRNASTTPPRDHNIERLRAADRASPQDLDSRRQREPVSARESPVARQPHSPSTFTPAQPSLPDRTVSDSPARSSPLGGGSSGDTYTPYMTRDPPSHRRATVNSLNSEPRTQYSQPTHTPPLQSVGRPPDRSLPVQEEPEDDPHPPIKDADPWQGLEHLENRHQISSPISSSDTYPEGNVNRSITHHPSALQTEDYSDDDIDEGAKTPRSPSVGLPDRHAQPMTSGTRVPVRPTGRVSSMDHVGLRSITEAIHQPAAQNGVPGPSHSPNVHRFGPQLRRLNVDPNASYQSAQYYASESSPYSGYPGQFIPEEYYGYDASTPYYQDFQYDNRPRPDAPIPPTPHSQTAAPSPSPFPHARNGRNFADPRPIHAGSPYPAPFEHVRRNVNISRNARHSMFDPNDPSFDMNIIRDQVAGQWQTFAQNTHALGNMSDSTFSPSATPFPGNFGAWANLHARRTLNRAFDIRSLQSSPGLEPPDRGEAPSVAPSYVFRSKKKPTRASGLSTEIAPRPPPRVQSTQPRDTSPEPSTSGEETAGEDTYTTTNPNRNSWGNGTANHVVDEDGDADWVDEDEEPDEDDLLELEYHPLYVKNVARRRKKWDVGWESLLDAFHALDRQTDATMVLLAAPSHETKLYSVRSRSIRRQHNGPDINPLKNGFKRIAAHRRKTRSNPNRSSLVDRFLTSSSGEGSESETREEDLKRALEAAVNSLGAFESIFAEREARWAEEMRRISDDRERVETLLRQVIGERNGLNTTPTASLPLL
ncbi:hypothetical protein NP233_g7470 [Leucocoprinus birnbaumii]|uniref:Uncharacterized protein n=1 Tax=Leucocoprinus birnbaumii TaxID=56174 RepID=A0AAD5VP89_9AGAR|nr:hypothetical protein NP233_g7470 [Leucocoprinus birnbaumii]